MLEEAERIFQDILDSAIRINGEQTWFVSEIAASDASDEAISQKLMDNSFYNGFSGLSVFAGALYQSTGNKNTGITHGNGWKNVFRMLAG